MCVFLFFSFPKASQSLLTFEYNKRVEALRKKGWDQSEYRQINEWYLKQQANSNGNSISVEENVPSAYSMEEAAETVSGRVFGGKNG